MTRMPCALEYHPDEISRVPHRLSELQPQHHAAIRLRVEGRSTEEICEQLGVEKRTVYLWFSDPLIKAALADQVARVNELFAERLAAASVRAIEELIFMARQPTLGPLTPDVKLKVLREILDRAAPAQQPRHVVTEGSFARLSDEELFAQARRLASGLVAGADPGTASSNGRLTQP